MGIDTEVAMSDPQELQRSLECRIALLQAGADPTITYSSDGQESDSDAAPLAICLGSTTSTGQSKSTVSPCRGKLARDH